MSAPEQQPGRRHVRIISRDSVLWLVGLGLMIYQGFGLAAEFNLAAFLGGMVIAGVPGAIQAIGLIVGQGGAAPPPPSPSPAPLPLPEPSTPSSGP